VRSAAVGDGYFPESNSALGEGRFVPDDFVSHGDRGMTIVGRASDVINVAGRKLNPRTWSSVLRECPGVRQTVVFGVPSSLRGEEAVACIVGEGIDPRKRAAFLPGQLESSGRFRETSGLCARLQPTSAARSAVGHWLKNTAA
jgi:acyl-CoA synthetase (AMP-forming)/AMP-acid ligase II